MQDITLYNASNVSKVGKGRVTSVGLKFSPQGLPVAGKKWSVAFHTESFISIMAAGERFEKWQAEFIDSQGNTIKGVFNEPLIDNTIGYVVTILTEIKA